MYIQDTDVTDDLQPVRHLHRGIKNVAADYKLRQVIKLNHPDKSVDFACVENTPELRWIRI